jgi:hypothetical protein
VRRRGGKNGVRGAAYMVLTALQTGNNLRSTWRRILNTEHNTKKGVL